MKKELSYVLILFAIASCMRRQSSTNQDVSLDDIKLEYKVEENKVEVISLQRTAFKRQIVSNGKVSAVRKASLTFGTSGTITFVGASQGCRVTKGTLIAKLERPDLDLALQEAQIALDRAGLDLLDRLVGLGYQVCDTSSIPSDVMTMARMRSGYTSAKNALEKARYDKALAELRAPFSGIVANVAARIYDSAPSGPFCMLIDDSSLEVSFDVMEADYAKVAKGMGIKVSPFSEGSGDFRGSISAVNPTIGKNGLVTVLGSIPRVSGLVDGMNVRVLVEQSVPGCFVVPKSAVVIRDNLNVLFTYTDDGIAHWVYVNIIDANSDSYAIKPNASRGAKLSEGDKVIISGNLNLADESKVSL